MSYHEGIPGHHLQIAISEVVTCLPEFRKQSYYTAFTDGWALYLASGSARRSASIRTRTATMEGLEADIWRAIRLVVDTGAFTPKHWTRQQMVDFFREHSAIDETNIQAEVDRYVAWLQWAGAGLQDGPAEDTGVEAKSPDSPGTEVRPQSFP